MTARRRTFGAIRRLPSKRWQASYLGPDGARHTARTPTGRALTFTTKGDADGWLAVRQAEIIRGEWRPPAPRALTLTDYAARWLDRHELAGSSRRLYAGTLRRHILPELGGLPVASITPAAVGDWHAGLAGRTGKTQRAGAYSLLATIMRAAVAEDVITASPCRLRGARTTPRERDVKPATAAEIETIADAMPPRLALAVLLAAWCAPRFGELAALRRCDVDLRDGVLRITRAVARTDHGYEIKAPKSAAGRRTVAIPPHLIPAVRAHLAEHVAPSQDALIFPGRDGGCLTQPGLAACYHRARAAAERTDLRWHDLRHTGASLAVEAGASLPEVMRRLGHSTVRAALIYQHADDDRDAVIAAALSEHAAGGQVVKLRPRRSRAAGRRT